MRNIIREKGLIKAPVHFEKSILSYAEKRLIVKEENEDEIRQYLEWLPFSFLMFIIRDIVKGKEIQLRPVIDY